MRGSGRDRDGDDEMADISRVIPDGAGAIRLSPGGSCQEASRFEEILISINDAQFQRDTGSSVKLLLCASRVSRRWRRPMVAGKGGEFIVIARKVPEMGELA
jgi:hypothetical protein